MGGSTSLKEECSLGNKSKRKRTSPQDHTILEAAYLANSKPGKEERASIVSRVQLGEKEVQIWFQNRRQNDRRRSKPLQPHELIAHITNTTSPAQCTGARIAAILPSAGHDHAVPTPSPETQASQPSLHSQEFVTDKATSTPETSTRVETCSSSDCPAEQAPSVTDAVDKTPQPQPRSRPTTTNSSARKRSYHEMVEQQAPTPAPSASISANAAPAKVKEPLKRSSSIRLTMTVDGAVKIRTTESPTPSPEKERALPPTLPRESKQRRLSRSVSMVDDLGGATKAAKATGVFGRSRDHRKWEFYCDNSADKALSIQAEAERSGSAVGAINLIRVNSLKGHGLAMSPMSNRGNVGESDHAKPTKPKICRVKSSSARLSSQSYLGKKEVSKTTLHARSPSDSDKENWAPGTQMSQNLLRRTQPSNNNRPILRDNEAILFPDASLNRAKTSIAKVMPRKEKTRGEDLDCIQGLLSLSQGAWR